ncbi:MAG: imelysin family protein [Cellulophaga sp.]
MKKYIGIVLLACLVWTCSSDNGGSDNDGGKKGKFDRKAMLTNWADNIIIPSYAAFFTEISNLKTAFQDFESTTDQPNLETLRAAWLKAYKSWQHVSMFEIGPAETAGLRYSINIYPTNTEKIEGYVISGTYDFTLSSNRVAKGFPALDYLLNGLGDTDEAILAKYTSGTTGSNYKSYVNDVIVDIEELTNEVTSGWAGDYRDTFINNDGASATASVDKFVNDYIFYYEKFLRAGKMGIPLGAFSGVKSTKHVEALYKKDVSKELFLEGLNASQDFFNGKHFGKSTKGESLNSYLKALNSVKDGADLGELINNQFNKARTSVNNLDAFLEELSVDGTKQMLLAYDEVQRIVPFFKVDMVSAMSISIDYVDADGD